MKSASILATLFTIALGAPTSTHMAKRAGNVQTFTGALGGIAATPIENTGDAKRPFSVKGATFVNIGAALQRSCDQQFNACANKANGGDKTLSVSACNDQKTQCDAAGQGATNVQASAGEDASAQASPDAAAATSSAATCVIGA